MHDWITIVGLTLFAGLAMPLGAALAAIEHLKTDWLETEFRHGVIAFGGGALLSAVALVLVPESMESLTPVSVAFCFLGGGVAFMALDVLLDRLNSPMGQLAAMLSDFIPEALALGATIAAGGEAGILLAALMALQNAPEGFNAFRELDQTGKFSSGKIILAFAVMALLGPVCGLLGFYCLSAYPVIVAGIMVFAAGGILYIVFQDIAPQVRLKDYWAPPLGAVAGFLLGVIGQMLVQASG
ncbi:MAG: divalent cation transporter [Pirellulales bacterium]|nr:divalent cation transporter [Pirellulales bacterium]